MTLRSVLLLALLALSVGGSAQETAPSDEPDARAEASFEGWLADYRARALAGGANPAALAAVTGSLRYSPRVVELDRAQPDDSGTAARFGPYLERRLDATRIARGRQVKSDMAATLADIELRYGVPAAVILGIWGMESNYGSHTGNFDVPRSVATLAYDGRRRELFTAELDASVEIVARGLADRSQLRGSWAGAMGQPQFLPSSYLKFAVDGSGDGKADIWSSGPDVAASIANYLSKNGWQRGQPWGMQVAVPASFERWRVRNLIRPETCVRPMERHSRWITIGEWRKLGLLPTNRAWPADDVLATLVEPDGPGLPAYLTFGNYRALLAYNCSNFYALSVGLLADALQ